MNKIYMRAPLGCERHLMKIEKKCMHLMLNRKQVNYNMIGSMAINLRKSGRLINDIYA